MRQQEVLADAGVLFVAVNAPLWVSFQHVSSSRQHFPTRAVFRFLKINKCKTHIPPQNKCKTITPSIASLEKN